MDLLVLSSSYGEGFSNVILESMSMSIPCIVSDVGDNKRIVSNNEYVFNKGDINYLSKIINNYINLSNESKYKIKTSNRKNIRENYETEIILKKYNELWD